MRSGLLTPFKVGLLVLAGIAGFVWYAQQVADVGLDQARSYTLYAYFNDATGIEERGLVTIAGVRVGQVEKITLERGKARVVIRLRDDIVVHADGAIAKRFESILGDAILELATGTESARALKEGDEIRKVIAVGGVDAILTQMEFTAQNIRDVTDTLRRLLGSGEGSLLSIIESADKIAARAETLVERVETTVQISAGIAERTGRNLEQISGEMVGLTSESSAAFRELLAEAEVMASQLRQILQNIDAIVATGEGEFRSTTAALRDTLKKVDESMLAMRSVTEKVDQGEGTLGRLINDDKLINTLETSLEDASVFLGQLARLQTRVDVRSELQLFPGGRIDNKNVFALEFAPRKDKYYLVELVDNPRGHRSRELITEERDGLERTVERTTTTGRFKLSAQFAKRYYFTTLRLGLMENTGGVGADLYAFDDALKLRLDLFDIGDDAWPRLRALASYTLFEHVYLMSGVDDVFNASDTFPFGRALVFSAGLRFTDQDLRSLIAAVPLP